MPDIFMFDTSTDCNAVLEQSNIGKVDWTVRWTINATNTRISQYVALHYIAVF